MNKNHDADLRYLFAQIPEPAEDEMFTKRVSRQLTRHRRNIRIVQILLACLMVAILAVVSPWLINTTSHITLGANLVANFGLAILLSPIGWIIGGWVGLFVFLKTR